MKIILANYKKALNRNIYLLRFDNIECILMVDITT